MKINKFICATLLTSVTFAGAATAQESKLLTTYTQIAHAAFTDSLSTAQALSSAVDQLVANPSEASLINARTAWLASRVPYQQTEVYRFGNAIVDDWEGRVNAWPLDEGLIDYVDASYGQDSESNMLYTANVIANPKLKIGGREIDASNITPALLQDALHEAGGSESNVATGYHAIEFLLWGQDLNGTNAGAGNRQYTDFDTKNCSNANCDRRAQYLQAATTLLVSDLAEMLANWTADGAAVKQLEDAGEVSAINTMLTGMGSLSYGELAGERIRLGLMLNDPEEEHDCFSDNTHNSHFYDALGVQNVYLGQYTRTSGEIYQGASLSAHVAAIDKALDAEMQQDLANSVAAMQVMVARAEAGEAYDQMIGEGNTEGNAVIQATVDTLVKQTRTMERIVSVLGLSAVEIAGSDSLDNPNAVFQ